MSRPCRNSFFASSDAVVTGIFPSLAGAVAFGAGVPQAVQIAARTARRPYYLFIDEASRFVGKDLMAWDRLPTKRKAKQCASVELERVGGDIIGNAVCLCDQRRRVAVVAVPDDRGDQAGEGAEHEEDHADGHDGDRGLGNMVRRLGG